MSDHFDAEDGRTDLTDIYLFGSGTPGRSVLVACFNPDPADTDPFFDPAAWYELKLDTDDDAIADLAFHVRFAGAGDSATASVHRAIGAAAAGTGAVGDLVVADAPVSVGARVQVTDQNGLRFFAGLRSDPHFKDILGFRNNFQFTGTDPVANRNVVGIAIEVPDAILGSRAPVHYWARTMAPLDGVVRQVDQAGRPGVNNTFNTEEDDNAAFCRSSPVDQPAVFGPKFLAFLASLGYPADEAAALLPTYLPDWLVYDPAQASGYPNGRRLTDDTADLLAALLTRGRITSDGVGPHTDLLAGFPYLGPPRPEPGPTV